MSGKDMPAFSLSTATREDEADLSCFMIFCLAMHSYYRNQAVKPQEEPVPPSVRYSRW